MCAFEVRLPALWMDFFVFSHVGDIISGLYRPPSPPTVNVNAHILLVMTVSLPYHATTFAGWSDAVVRFLQPPETHERGDRRTQGGRCSAAPIGALQSIWHRAAAQEYEWAGKPSRQFLLNGPDLCTTERASGFYFQYQTKDGARSQPRPLVITLCPWNILLLILVPDVD